MLSKEGKYAFGFLIVILLISIGVGVLWMYEKPGPVEARKSSVELMHVSGDVYAFVVPDAQLEFTMHINFQNHTISLIDYFFYEDG